MEEHCGGHGGLSLCCIERERENQKEKEKRSDHSYSVETGGVTGDCLFRDIFSLLAGNRTAAVLIL